jgi:hypothetical protein
VSCGHEIEPQVVQNVVSETIEFDEAIARDVGVGCGEATLVSLDERNKDISPVLSHIRHLTTEQRRPSRKEKW